MPPAINVPPSLEKAVVFIFARNAEQERVPIGTGFLVSVPVAGEDDRAVRGAEYLIDDVSLPEEHEANAAAAACGP